MSLPAARDCFAGHWYWGITLVSLFDIPASNIKYPPSCGYFSYPAPYPLVGYFAGNAVTGKYQISLRYTVRSCTLPTVSWGVTCDARWRRQKAWDALHGAFGLPSIPAWFTVTLR